MAGIVNGRAWALAAGIFVALGGAAAQAATISTGSLAAGGIALDVSGVEPCSATGSLSTNVGEFSRISGPDGSGTASCGDRSSPQVKSPLTPHPYGRFNPDGGAWVDSNDVRSMLWSVDVGRAVRSVSFALTDAHDQPRSHFRIEAEGATWRIEEREANGTLHLVKILFDVPTANPEVRFFTRLNDGYGLAQVSVQPVPVPPAALLLLSGVGVFAVMRRRATRAA